MFPLYDLNPHHRFPWLTLLMIAANVARHGWTLAPQRCERNKRRRLRYGFMPSASPQLSSGKPVLASDLKVDQRPVSQCPARANAVRLSGHPADVYPTFFTTMFLHGGWIHLLTNMWMLWIFGNNIEDRLGHLMYVCFYLVGGIVATLTHLAVRSERA